MTTLPLIRSTQPGIYTVCEAANTDYTIPIPTNALGCVIAFEHAGTYVVGRVGMDQSDAPVDGITDMDTVLGYHPPTPMQYDFGHRTFQGGGIREDAEYIHVACSTAGAVVKGMFLFASDRAAS